MKKTFLLFLALGFFALASSAKAANTYVATQKILRSGVSPTANAIDYTNGNSISITAGELIVINSSAMDVTMTAVDYRVSLEGYSTNATCFAPAGQVKVCGPYIASRWSSNGVASFTWTASGSTTGRTFWALRLPYGEPENQTK